VVQIHSPRPFSLRLSSHSFDRQTCLKNCGKSKSPPLPKLGGSATLKDKTTIHRRHSEVVLFNLGVVINRKNPKGFATAPIFQWQGRS
jgi:hypothetical protein